MAPTTTRMARSIAKTRYTGPFRPAERERDGEIHGGVVEEVCAE
jgi:hypothetical protein